MFFALNKRTWIRLVLMIMSVELRNKCLNAYRQGNLVRKANKLFPRKSKHSHWSIRYEPQCSMGSQSGFTCGASLK